MSRVFLKFDNTYYKDFSVITESPTIKTNDACHLITNYGIDNRDRLSVHTLELQKLLTPSASPTKGSSIHVLPGCILPSADIRKNYTLKRKSDQADYIVFCKTPQCFISNYCECAILPSRKAVIFKGKVYNRNITLIDFLRIARNCPGYEDVQLSDFEPTVYTTSIYNSIVEPEWIELLNGTLQKPAVPYTSLDMNFGLEMTDDIVELLFRTGMGNDVNKCALEIATLSQYNWRDYPRTMYFLTGILLNNRYSAYSGIKSRQSSQTKQIQQVINCQFSKQTSSIKDYEMAKRFMLKLFGLEDGVKFINYDDVAKNANKHRVPLWLFHDFFDTIVRISPVKYETINNTL